MWRYRCMGTTASLLFAGMLLGADAQPAVAQNGNSRPLFEWSGRVDREVQLTMRGRNVWTRAYGQMDQPLPGPDIMTALPQNDGVVRVLLEHGLGEVQVVQQPTSENDYTAIVRIRDRSNSGEPNRITVSWLPYASSGGEVVERSDVAAPRGRYAGERTVLHWTGRVDDAIEIRIRGQQLDYRTLSGDEPEDIHSNLAPYGLPMDYANVRIHQLEGRGTVTLVQQPNAENNFMAVLRIYDPQPRTGFYDFDLTVPNR